MYPHAGSSFDPGGVSSEMLSPKKDAEENDWELPEMDGYSCEKYSNDSSHPMLSVLVQ